jgi:hypothetical protein
MNIILAQYQHGKLEAGFTLDYSNNSSLRGHHSRGLVMTGKERKCLACGRPLTGRKRKWCGQCRGWEALHPPVTIKCECGNPIETYKGSGRTTCGECLAAAIPIKTCIECGEEYAYGGPFPWCGSSCYYKYFEKNPQPDYFKKDRELTRRGLCFGCSKQLADENRSFGFCSATCHAIYRVRSRYRHEDLKEQILEEKGEFAAWIYQYVWGKQFLDVHPDQSHRWDNTTPEYQKEYRNAYGKESRRMKIRKQLGLPEDALLPESSIPETTELPIKLWLEENNIEFEPQKYIEIGSTFTYVDFFIPLPDSDRGICLYCDGDYWHGPDFPETIEKDAMQRNDLEKQGYIVIRLWESAERAGETGLHCH